MGGRRRRAKAPPLFTFGGGAVFGLGMIAGYQVANMGARYYEGMNPTANTTGTGGTATTALPSGITSITQYNDLVQSAPPSLYKTGIELGVAALGFVIGILAKSPLVKLAGYGWGFGALAHIVGQLLDTYIILPMMVTTSATTTAGTTGTSTLGTYGQIMYQHEYTAQQAKAAAAAVSGSTSLGSPPQVVHRGGTAVPQKKQPPVMLAQAQAPAAGTLGAPAHLTPGGQGPGTGIPVQAIFPGSPGGAQPPPPGQGTGGPPPGSNINTNLPAPGLTNPPVIVTTPPIGASPPGSNLGTQPGGGVGTPTPTQGAAGACTPCGDPPDDNGPTMRKVVPMREAMAMGHLRNFNNTPQRRSSFTRAA